MLARPLSFAWREYTKCTHCVFGSSSLREFITIASSRRSVYFAPYIVHTQSESTHTRRIRRALTGYVEHVPPSRVAQGAVSLFAALQYDRSDAGFGGGSGGAFNVCRVKVESVAPNAASLAAIAPVQLNLTALAWLTPPGSVTIAFTPTVWPALVGSRTTGDHSGTNQPHARSCLSRSKFDATTRERTRTHSW